MKVESRGRGCIPCHSETSSQTGRGNPFSCGAKHRAAYGGRGYGLPRRFRGTQRQFLRTNGFQWTIDSCKWKTRRGWRPRQQMSLRGVEAPPPTIEYEKRNILTVGADIIRPIYFNPSALPTPFLFSLLSSLFISYPGNGGRMISAQCRT